MRWQAFADGCPQIAGLAEERLRHDQVCMLGTLRRDGSPRISPCEPDFVDGRLMMGMMWRSRKALDLLRDPRCVVHSCTTSRMGDEGDIKLYAHGSSVDEPGMRERYRETIRARIDWAPDEPNYHLFEFDIESAGFVIFGDERYGLAWTPAAGVRRWSLAG